MAAKVPLGTILLQRGIVTQDQINEAMVEQARTSRSLGRVLVSNGAVTEADLVSALAEQAGLEFIDLGDQQVDPAAASTISDLVARRYQALTRLGTLKHSGDCAVGFMWCPIDDALGSSSILVELPDVLTPADVQVHTRALLAVAAGGGR